MRKRHSGDDVSDLMRNDTQASGKRNSMVKQLATIERKIAGIVRAIEDGAYTPTLKERLIALEAEEACLEARLAEIGRRAPVRLHPNAPELYRSMIANGDPALLTTDLSFFGLLSAQLPKVAKLPSSNARKRWRRVGRQPATCSRAKKINRLAANAGMSAWSGPICDSSHKTLIRPASGIALA